MSVINTQPLIGASGQGGAYNLERSLRFRASSSAYLTRTPSVAGNRQTWTWSAWVKRGALSAGAVKYLIDGRSGTNMTALYFTDQDALQFEYYDGTLSYYQVTSAVFRDPAAWYHIVAVFDTTNATSSNRMRLYVNGVQVTSYIAAGYPIQNLNGWINNTNAHAIGARTLNSNHIDGYLSEVNFIDGQALTPSSFGENDTLTGVWKPKRYAGTYGTNGFYLPFKYPTVSTSYAATFNGSNQYLQFNGESGFAFSTNDFTIETWINPTRNDTGVIWDARPASTNGNYGLLYFSGSGILEYNVNGSALMTSPVIAVNAWTHVALVRTSGTIKLYINGVNVASASDGTAYGIPSGRPVIGVTGWNLSVAFFSGKMSNYRVVNGTAVYTGNFLPSTAPLTAITNTKLLTLQNSSLIDNSSSAVTVNNINGVTLATDSPFATIRHITADQSGNSNHWSSNNIGLTAGATYDSMTDVPTLTSATASNYAVLNPLDKNSSVSTADGNLQLTNSNSSWLGLRGSMGMSTGKWYVEYSLVSSLYAAFGIANASAALNGYVGVTGTWGYVNDGSKDVNGTNTSGYGSSFTTNDIIGMAFDADAGTLTFYKNNVSQGTLATGISAGTYFPWMVTYNSNAVANFGQRPFTYTPPTGYIALNTYNLPTSTIVAGNKYMDATIYSGSGNSGQSITNTGGFKPDLVWTKARSTNYNNILYDSVRGTGTTKSLYSDDTAVEGAYSTYTNLSSFDSSGWTIGSTAGNNAMNASGQTFVGWQWQAGQGTTSTNTSGSITSTVSVNPSAGFSIVSFNKTASTVQTVGHGLGVAPSLVIIKEYQISAGWPVYHAGLGANKYLLLNTTDAAGTSSIIWNNTNPSSSVITLGTGWASTTNMIAYCWSEVAGFSKFGIFTGNGTTDNTFVYTGFRPKFVMIKATTGVDNWFTLDSTRNPSNVANSWLSPNLTNAEGVDPFFDLLSNGFKMRLAGNTPYIYMAFAENPFKYSLAR